MEHPVVAITLSLVWLWELGILATETNKSCSCYSFHTTKITWEESDQYCQQNGGNLVSMETEEEYQFINKTIQSLDIGDNEWHIGLTKTSGDWKWTSGQNYTITDKWVPGQPSGNGDCVKMIKDYRGLGMFDDINCGSWPMFICEHSEANTCLNTKSIITNLCRGTSPPEKSVSLTMVITALGTCYSVNTFRKNWTESNQYCQQNGGKLVSIETEEEYQFMNETIQSLDVEDNEWYIGLRRSAGGWNWTNGQSYHNDTFLSKWAPVEPSIGGGDCVKMTREYRGRGLLINVTCRLDYMFICEYKSDIVVFPGERISCPKIIAEKTKKNLLSLLNRR